MPIDRTTIQTRLKIHPDLLSDPCSYIKEHQLKVRTLAPNDGKKSRNHTKKLTLDVSTYKGIRVELCEGIHDGFSDVKIEFNPGVCLYGHNGRILLLREFVDALGILISHLKPILLNQDDWVDLIPGVRPKGVAYWSYLELFLHIEDPDGSVLKGFRNAQGRNSQTPVRHWADSMEIGSKRSNIQYSIYRKAIEMVEHKKLEPKQLEDDGNILRLEVRLKGNKLVQYLGNERNMEEIDGVKRVTKFYPHELNTAHCASFGDLNGVYRSNEPLAKLAQKEQMKALGRLLARVSNDPRTTYTFLELRDQLHFYTDASSATLSAISGEGLKYLSHVSRLRKEDLFSDDAYRKQITIFSEKKENYVRHYIDDIYSDPRIFQAYQPPDQRLLRINQFPSYYLEELT